MTAAWGWNALGGGFIFGREDNMAFQLISVAAFAAFYGCYFVKMLRQKRRGIQTDQLGKGKAGFVKFVEITMKAAAVLAFAAGLISIFTGTGRSPAAG